MTFWKEASVNRKQWIIAGVIVVLVVIGLLALSGGGLDNPQATGENDPVHALAYCADEQARPCIVSFSADARENMIINFLLPDLSFPAFYLKVVRGGGETTYACQRVTSAPNTAYCAGPKQPPGEALVFQMISSRDETLLAEGNLSIIGLAFPTLGIAISTPQEQAPLAVLVESPTPTALSLLVLPPVTETLPTVPAPSYPNPSYPNPSYP